MKIDPERLRTLREQRGLTRLKLAERSKISDRTIQRLEKEPQKSKKTQEHTLNSLAQALGVKTGVLTSELPLPESDKASADDDLDRVQIGAQIAPKTRLAYDLVKHRYGVNATDIINMAPLFFVLLAEGSLAQRREKLKEVEDMLVRLDEIRDTGGTWSAEFSQAAVLAEWGSDWDKASIASADIFGEDLLDTDVYAFEPNKINPFVHYLRNLAGDLAIPDVVDVDKGDLNFRSQYKFPYYDICREELDNISNGSPKARRTLETGHVRLSEIPEELMAEDAGERRVKWLEDKLPPIYNMEGGDSLAEMVAKDTEHDLKQKIEDMESQKVDSQKTNSETEKEGDDK